MPLFIQRFIIALCVVLWPMGAQALTIRHVSLIPVSGQTRIIINVQGNAANGVHAFVMPDPWRLAVDMPTFDWQAGKVTRPQGNIISGLRQGPLNDHTSRIVFDLTGPAVVKTVSKTGSHVTIIVAASSDAQAHLSAPHVLGTLTEAEAAPPPQPAPAQTLPKVQPSLPTAKKAEDEVAADVAAEPAHAPSAHAPPTPKAKPAPKKTTTVTAAVIPPDQDAPPRPFTPEEKPLIIIDPGHGGIDPGTHGPDGIVEKNVTLAEAQTLRDTLVQTGRYRVLLTRDSDVYLYLPQRVAFARGHHGDLFISLHADSSPTGPDARGASIYTLSDTASDAETARLATQENKADDIAGMDLRNQDTDVAGILVDLAMRDTINHSAFLANTVADSLHASGIPTLERAHRAAGFAVLKDPDVPSILVEMGFLSNPDQAADLTDPAFQHQLAVALMDSIDQYFAKVRSMEHPQ